MRLLLMLIAILSLSVAGCQDETIESGGPDQDDTDSTAGGSFSRAAVWAVTAPQENGPLASAFKSIARFAPLLTSRQAVLETAAEPSSSQTFPNPHRLAVCGDHLYVSSFGYDSLEAVNLETLQVDYRFRAAGLLLPVCSSNRLWAVELPLKVHELPLDLEMPLHTYSFSVPPLSTIYAAGDQVLAVDLLSGLHRIEPAEGSVETIHLRADGLLYNVIGIAVIKGNVWVVGSAGGEKSLLKVDMKSGTILKTIHLAEASDIAVALGRKALITGGFEAIWVADRKTTTLFKLDPEDGTPLCSMELGATVTALTTDSTTVLAGTSNPGKIHRIKPTDCSITGELAVDSAISALAVSE